MIGVSGWLVECVRRCLSVVCCVGFWFGASFCCGFGLGACVVAFAYAFCFACDFVDWFLWFLISVYSLAVFG